MVCDKSRRRYVLMIMVVMTCHGVSAMIRQLCIKPSSVQCLHQPDIGRAEAQLRTTDHILI